MAAGQKSSDLPEAGCTDIEYCSCDVRVELSMPSLRHKHRSENVLSQRNMLDGADGLLYEKKTLNTHYSHPRIALYM